MPTTYTLSISYTVSGSGTTVNPGGPTVTGTDVDSVTVPEISGTGSVVLYKMEDDTFTFFFDNAGYNSGSGAVGYYDNGGSFTATLRLSGTTVILSGSTSLTPHYGNVDYTHNATAKVIVFSSSRAELYADSGIALPQLASLTPSGTISRVQYIVNQSVSGHVGKYSVKPIGSKLYRFR